MPRRIVLRDLDASILDPRRTRSRLRDLRLEVAKDTWTYMPAFELGKRRLVQAMLFGHLGEVMWWLTQSSHVKQEKLVAAVDDTWSDLAAQAPSRSVRKTVNELRSWSDDVKATLRTRLTRGVTLQFVRRQRAHAM
jgi:siderophore synthetase component